LGIGGEDLGHRVFELASLLDQRADLLHPLVGDTLHAFFTVDHES